MFNNTYMCTSEFYVTFGSIFKQFIDSMTHFLVLDVVQVKL